MSSSPKQRAAVGLLEWFRVGEYEQVERALDELDGLRANHLRTGISWADFLRPGGREWYDWLLPKLAGRAELLPCVSYTPPNLGEMPGTNAPPKRLDDYADFVAYLIELYGEHFEWVELWNEPDNHREWNAAFDTDYAKFAQMAGNAAKWAKHFGKKTLLGGLANADPNFLSLLHDHGALQHFDAVGVHGFPFSFEHYWEGWQTRVARLRERLDWCGRPDCELWITETGYSTWRHDDRKQISTFLDAIEAPADRVYWYSLVDLHPDLPTVDGFHSDEREYHFGLKTADGNDKLLGRLWKTYGLDGIKPYADLIRNKSTHAPPGGEAALAAGFGDAPRAGDPAAKAASPARGETSAQRQRHTLVTGGAGFVGTNVADRVCREGGRVTILDNLSRPGVEANAVWLKQTHGDRVRIVCADLLDEHAVRDATRGAEAVYHFAAQVAVTTSLDAPVHDFLANARGTINVLEAVRRQSDPPPLIFTSTNKVYGDLGDVDLKLVDGRWSPADPILRRRGIGEGRPLDFPQPLRLLQGQRGPVRFGLRPHLQPADVRAADELHLRPASTRHRRSRLGRPLRPRRPPRRAGHPLRRRQTGPRRAVRRRFGRRDAAGGEADRPSPRRGVQRRRRPGPRGQPARRAVVRLRPSRPGRGDGLRRLAHRRPEVLRQRHQQAGAGRRLAAAGLAGRRHRPAVRMAPRRRRHRKAGGTRIGTNLTNRHEN